MLQSFILPFILPSNALGESSPAQRPDAELTSLAEESKMNKKNNAGSNKTKSRGSVLETKKNPPPKNQSQTKYFQSLKKQFR